MGTLVSWLICILTFDVSMATIPTNSRGPSCNISLLDAVFKPDSLDPILEGMVTKLHIELPLDLTDNANIVVTSSNERVAKIRHPYSTNETRLLQYRTGSQNDKRSENFTECHGLFYIGQGLKTNIELAIEGVRLGKSNIVVSIIPNESMFRVLTDEHDDAASLESKSFPSTYQVVVLRNVGLDDKIFHIVIQVVLAFINFGFGCDLNLDIVKGYLKRPLAPSIGLCSQFIFMPLLGVVIAQILRMDSAYSIGLISLACAPGGGASNAWTKLLDGDVNLSLTMTFVSLTLALGMMPLWMFLVSRLYLPPSAVRIPYLKIFTTLCYFVAPCFVGILLNKIKPKLAQPLTKFIKPLAIFFLLWVVTFGTYVNLYMWVIMHEVPLTVLAGILLPWCGFVFGLSLALVFRQGRDRSIAICIETGIQNIGVPIVLLQRSFPQPDGDLAATLANSVSIFAPLPLFVALIILTIKKSCSRSNDKELIAPVRDVKTGMEGDESSETLFSSAIEDKENSKSRSNDLSNGTMSC